MNIYLLSTKEEVLEVLEQTLKEKSELENKNAVLENENAVLREKVSILEEYNNRLRIALYASKSEKKVSKDDDKSDINDPLPDDDEPDGQSAAANTDAGADMDSEAQAPKSDEQASDVNATTDSAKKKTDKAAGTRTKKSRSRKQDNEERILSRLLVRHVEHPAEDDGTELYCCCGEMLVKTSEDTITKIEFVPGYFVEHSYRRPHYRCPRCEGDPEQACPLPKALENEILPEALVTNDLLATIVYYKYGLAIPLYRQRIMFRETGIYLTEATMCRWIVQASKLCEPLYDEILRQIQSGETINMDETKLQVLKEDGRSNKSISYIWQMSGGKDGLCRLYHYNPHRSTEVAISLLDNFSGFLQTDGYAVYKVIGQQEGIISVACLDHIRRKFVEVVKCSTTGTTSSGCTVAEHILEEIGKIYYEEKVLRNESLPDDVFLKKRQEIVGPIIDAIGTYITEQLPNVPAKSLLGRALAYACEQWNSLRNYLLHAKLGPSNQVSENAIRPVAVGRKNYLFAGHPNGAKALSIQCTLIETAKANSVSPLDYLKYVFAHIRTTALENIASLLPWNCFP